MITFIITTSVLAGLFVLASTGTAEQRGFISWWRAGATLGE